MSTSAHNQDIQEINGGIQEIKEIKDIWMEAFELGLNTGCLSGKEAWEQFSVSLDDEKAIGEWIKLTSYEKSYLLIANQLHRGLDDKLSKKWLILHFNSQPHRLRAPKNDGGKGCSASVRRISQIAFNLGSAAEMGDDLGFIPKLEDYVKLF